MNNPIILPDSKAFDHAWRSLSSWVNTKWEGAEIDAGGYGWGGVHGNSKTGFVAYPCLLASEVSKSLDRPCKVMDLGSGVGAAAFSFAKHGCQVVGIEIDRERFLISCSNYNRLIKAGLLEPEIKIEFYRGSFYPKEYEPRRFTPDGVDHFGDLLNRLRVGANNLNLSADFYRTIDFFYHYQVETVENILEFFVKYARPGALLYIVQHGGQDFYNKTPRGVNYLNMPDTTFPGEGHLYQKAY